jgi:hypothetical protein
MDGSDMTDSNKPISHRRRNGSETRRRGQRIAPRVTPEEYAEVDAKAEAAGLTVSSYARQVLLESVKTRSRRRPRADVATLARFCGELNRIGGNINQIARAVNLGELPCGADITQATGELREALRLVRVAMGFES